MTGLIIHAIIAKVAYLHKDMDVFNDGYSWIKIKLAETDQSLPFGWFKSVILLVEQFRYGIFRYEIGMG